MSDGIASLNQIAREENERSLTPWSLRQQPLPSVIARPPQSVSEAGNMLDARDVLLEGLGQRYIVESSDEVLQFVRVRPNAVTVLLEASAHIDAAFGPERLRAIRLVRDDSEGSSVFGIIFWPGSAQSGDAALRRFDEQWWLRNCHRAGGAVNFNFELV